MGMRRIFLLLASIALAVIFVSGVALADSPTTEEDCKNGGYAKYGFKNQGQCIKAVNHATPADTTPPETFVHGPAHTITSNTTQSFSFSSNESGVSFECRLIGRSDLWEPCNPPDDSITYTDLAEGDYTFEVRARDAAGNVDSSPASRTVTMDLTPPDPVGIVSGPTNDSTTTDNTPPWEFSSSEPPGGEVYDFECGFELSDGIHWAACESTYTAEPLADGEHTFYVRALDEAGNRGEWTIINFTVDTTP
jgi:large repetitive protein